MESASERTPLTGPPTGTFYLYPSRMQHRERQIRQFQCCLCSTFIGIIIAAFVFTIAASIQEGTGDASRIPDVNVNSTIILAFALPFENEAPDNFSLPQPTIAEQNEALQLGKIALGDRELYEERMTSSVLNTPSYRHQKMLSTSTEARLQSKRGYIENHATLSLYKQFEDRVAPNRNGRRWSVGEGPKIEFDKPTANGECDFRATYRTANGTCNNLHHPYTYGVGMQPFKRFLKPDYADGVFKPRIAHSGKELPSARDISVNIHRQSYKSDRNFTVMLAVWGQFLDHDITATAGFSGDAGQTVDCCTGDTPLHPECFPVVIRPGDPYYDDHNVTCMNFVRSAPAATGRFGPREQLNQATAYIDGSVIYGTTDNQIMALRTTEAGELRMYNTVKNRTLLPVSTDPTDGCNEKDMNAKGEYCFETGDKRANENLHLASMHLIWARHHNSLAKELAAINSHWSDEQLFQEARRIVGAQMQQITYTEFLPMILGEEFCETVGLTPNADQENDTYHEHVDSSVYNSFATSAFRFAHTLLPGLMNATRNANASDEAIALHKMLFNPYSLWQDDGLDRALGGAISTPLAKSDPYFSTELTQKLFLSKHAAGPKGCGLDLVSLNIQRGRDHGLPSYNEFRRHCRLSSVETWEKMATAVDSDSLDRIRAVYESPLDVDVYTGSLSEPPLNGIAGPLLSCLIANQFIRIKDGDRFWFERSRGPQRFTDVQLREIYNTTLAGIICRNADAVEDTQKYVMRRIDAINPLMSCKDVDTFNIRPWQEVVHAPMHSSQSFIKVISKNTDNSSSSITHL